MRKLLAVVCLSFITLSSSTQNIRDSLWRLLAVEKNDSIRLRLTAQLGYAYMSSNTDSAQYFAQQIGEYGRKHNIYRYEVISLNMTASIYSSFGNYGRALEMFIQALKICEQHNDYFRMQSVLANIANIYTELGDKRQALRHYFRILELIKKSKRDETLSTIWLNIGDVYEKLDILDSARLYTTMAKELAGKNDDVYIGGIAYNNLGNIYSKTGETEIALGYYRYGLSMMERANELYGMCEGTLGMAKIFQNNRNIDSALYYARLSTNIARDKGFKSELMKASAFLANYFKEQKKLDSAYTYMEMIAAVNDSLFSAEKTHQIQHLIFEENNRQLKIEADKLRAKKEREQNIQYGITAVVVLSFMIVFLVLSRSVIVNEKWIRYMGILALLLVFEFINLIVHPLLADMTHHSPFWMLAIMVVIASLLIPMHHRLEHFISHKLTAKNKKIRLAAAKKIVARLEREEKQVDEVE